MKSFQLINLTQYNSVAVKAEWDFDEDVCESVIDSPELNTNSLNSCSWKAIINSIRAPKYRNSDVLIKNKGKLKAKDWDFIKPKPAFNSDKTISNPKLLLAPAASVKPKEVKTLWEKECTNKHNSSNFLIRKFSTLCYHNTDYSTLNSFILIYWLGDFIFHFCCKS